MNGCQFLVEDCTMDGTDYDCEHPTYGTKYGCDRCPMFGRNGGKRQYRLVNPRVTPPNKACSRLVEGVGNLPAEKSYSVGSRPRSAANAAVRRTLERMCYGSKND